MTRRFPRADLLWLLTVSLSEPVPIPPKVTARILAELVWDHIAIHTWQAYHDGHLTLKDEER